MNQRTVEPHDERRIQVAVNGTEEVFMRAYLEIKIEYE
jgi:hypothetical protein